MPWSLVVLVDEDVVTGMMLGSGPNLGAERCQFLNNETGEDPFIKKKKQPVVELRSRGRLH
jgi:hypothetical protein